VSLETIPFNVPALSPQSVEHVLASLQSGKHSGDGEYTARASQGLRDTFGYSDLLLTTSCTHALEMASMLLKLGPGDEVIVPSFTFVSTASAVATRGATPVFADVRPDTLNLDAAAVEAAITSRTRAVSVVHYAGVAAQLDELIALCAKYDLSLIEDNAHGLGGTYRGQPLGTFGDMATLSFHETKNLQCGEGGALLLNQPELLEAAEIIREKGTNRSAFWRGKVDKYTWVALGSSYLPSDVLAAMLVGGIEGFGDTQAARMHAWDSYHTQLADWASENGVQLPTVPEGAQHPAHLYYMIMPEAADQAALIGHLASFGVYAVSHYVPLHSSPAGQRLGRCADGCEVTSQVSERLVRLPLHSRLTDVDIERVVEGVLSYEPAPPP